jgi:hypothetical protein
VVCGARNARHTLWRGGGRDVRGEASCCSRPDSPQSFNRIYCVLTHVSMTENINITFTSLIFLALLFKYNFMYERSTKSY